jgi:hypothetical protein
LGYRTVTYAEWDARWPGLIDRFGVMSETLKAKVPEQHRHKVSVVGDLMADVQAIAPRTDITHALGCDSDATILGFLPGSKPAKLRMGIPLMLAIAQDLHSAQTSHTLQYVIGVAPNLSLPELMQYADPQVNPLMSLMKATKPTLVEPAEDLPYFKLDAGPTIYLWQRFPALDLFSQCALCLTTVGANTAQLGALAIPMLVLIPTQQLDGLALTDGLPGFVARLPGLGALMRKWVNPLVLRSFAKSGKRLAWPNIWAKREVVPELFGPITAAEVSAIAQDYLTHPEKLVAMQQELRSLRGPAGAAERMADLVLQTINSAQ